MDTMVLTDEYKEQIVTALENLRDYRYETGEDDLAYICESMRWIFKRQHVAVTSIREDL